MGFVIILVLVLGIWLGRLWGRWAALGQLAKFERDQRWDRINQISKW